LFNSWGRDRYWRPSTAEVNAWVQQAPELPRLDAVKPVILRNNRWRCDHGWDIDLDDGSSYYVITNDLCLRGGIKNREGYGRIVENNIMVDSGLHPHVWYAASGDIFRRNIVWRDYRPALMPAPPWGQDMDYNLMHKEGKETAPAARLQKQSGRDEHSIVADAQFVDPAKGDYRVEDGSPALALGFVNFPMDQFGVQKPALKVLARTPMLPGQKPVAAAPALPPAPTPMMPPPGHSENLLLGMIPFNGFCISNRVVVTGTPIGAAIASLVLVENIIVAATTNGDQGYCENGCPYRANWPMIWLVRSRESCDLRRYGHMDGYSVPLSQAVVGVGGRQL